MEWKPQDQSQPIRWGTMIPLIGGSAIGCSKAAGNLPLFHLSYAAFAGNESHLENHWPEVPMFRLDKKSTDMEALQRILGQGEIDFVNSVCPCAGLSMLNTSVKGPSGRGSEAQQNQWMMKSAEFVLETVRPKVLWGENAPGLFLSLGEAMVPKLRALGMQYGYSFSMVKTNTELHGLPQQRMRTFYFFWRSPTVPLLNYTSTKAPHLHQFLNTIPEWATFQDIRIAEGKVTERFLPYSYILLRENLTHAEFVKKFTARNAAFTVSKYLEKNKLIEDCIAWLEENHPDSRWSTTSTKSRTFVKYLKHMKSKLEQGRGYWDDSPKFLGDHFTAVITKNVAFAAHPEQDRFFNIRELLHLMGMPAEFQVINPSKNWNHICQNVPVNTARDWAAEVIKFCRGELEMTPFVFLKQDNISQKLVAKELNPVKIEIKQELDLLDTFSMNSPMLDIMKKQIKEEIDEQSIESVLDEIKDIELEMKKENYYDEKAFTEFTEFKEEKRSFNSNYSQFIMKYEPTNIQPSPLKKMKVEEEDETVEIELDLDDDELEHYLEGIKLPSPKKEEVSSYYQCGVCLELVFNNKERAQVHVELCYKETSIKTTSQDQGRRKQCGACDTQTDSEAEMVEHWITACRKTFSREGSQVTGL